MKIVQKKPFRSLTVTASLTFLVLSSVVIFGSIGLELYFSFRAQQEVIINQQRLIAQNASNTVNNFLEEKFRILDQASDLNSFASNPENRIPAAKKLFGRDPSFRQIFIVDNKNQEFSKVSLIPTMEQIQFEKIRGVLLESVLDGNKYISPIYIDKATSEPMVIIAVPIKNVFQEVQGAFVAEVNLKFIWDLVNEIKIGQNGLVYVVDGNGYLIAFQDTSRVLQRENLSALSKVKEFLNNKNKLDEKVAEIVDGIQGKKVVSTFASLDLPNWAVVIELPLFEAYAPVVQVFSYSLLVMLLSFILAIFVGLYFARRITKGIISLNDAADKISQGKFDTKIELLSTKKENEIDQLASSFNTMSIKLQDLYAGMNEKIKEKTFELSNKVTEAEKSKSAILNLLEDIEEEKKKVEGVVLERTRDLNSEKARLLASINSIPFGFIVADKNNNIILKNRVMIEMFKLDSNKEISLDDIANIIGKDSDLKGQVEACIKGKSVCEIKEIIFDKKILRGIVAPVSTSLEEGGTIGYVFLLEDITDAKALERSRDEFFSIASHELRTPLTAIRGNSQMLRDTYKDKMVDKDMEEMISDIHESSTHLIDIVNDFLEVSRLEQGRIEIKKEKFDLSELITKVMKDMEEMSKQKGVPILYTSPEKAAFLVYSDKGRVEQILFNLLGNAVKFTSKGTINIKVEKTGDFIKTSVTDNGLGISEANQSLLFRKFQQASENVLARDITQGTGLGLYICRLIMDKLGGTIGLEKSVLGQGSTFVFTLPKMS